MHKNLFALVADLMADLFWRFASPTPNEPHIPAIASETRVMEHLRELRERREVQILLTIPPALRSHPQLRGQLERYARVVASLHGRRGLRRVVYPWQPRPLDPKQHPEARVARGRLSNPTALR